MKVIAVCTCMRGRKIRKCTTWCLTTVVDDDQCIYCRHYVYYKKVKKRWRPSDGIVVYGEGRKDKEYAYMQKYNARRKIDNNFIYHY